MNAIITKDPETIDRLSYGYLEIVHFGFEDDGGKYHDGIYEFIARRAAGAVVPQGKPGRTVR